MRPAVIFLLMLFSSLSFTFSQEVYNNCVNALEICPNTVFSVNNIGASVTFCPGCEDDFNFCFATDNSIWLTFTTNAAGGAVQVNFTNLIFEANAGQDNELQATILETAVPCNAGSYIQLGNCESNATTNFSLNAAGLSANTTYMVVIDGDNNGAGITLPAECTFDVSIAGAGVDRPPSIISIAQNSTDICENDVVTFSADVVNCPDTGQYNWYINGVLVAVTDSNEFQTAELNNGDLVTVETSCYTLCPEIISIDATPMTVYSFSVYAGEDQTANPGEAITLNGQTSASIYSWEPAYLFSDPNSLATTIVPNESITVSLTGMENGCTQTDYLTITISSELDIPNTFSPNGDNINETWVIEGIELYPNNAVKIYDRWGQEVFQTTGYSSVKTWNGDIRNKKATEGVYFYVIELGDDGKVVKGTLTLIR